MVLIASLQVFTSFLYLQVYYILHTMFVHPLSPKGSIVFHFSLSSFPFVMGIYQMPSFILYLFSSIGVSFTS